MRSLLALLALPLVAFAQADPEKALVEGLADKYFQKGEAKGLRGLYATYLEAKYAEDIRKGLGPKASEIQSFLNANVELKETLLAAIDPETDKVPAVFAVFRKLWEADPEKVKAFPQLAVAVCVVWDDPKAAYDYRGHAVRVKATYSEDIMKNRHLENFQYLTSQDSTISGVVQALPWEFLVHTVNTFTPNDEREWAVKTYGKKRANIGKIYPSVQYDKEMLRTEMANGGGKGICKLGGHPYSLESILKYGGVCAQQADFAARVAKSLAIPAEYVRGESNSGGRHAWVMWVEFKSATKEKLDFQLLSEGRYFGDQYYVGTFEDPHSGKEMTDRDLERRLTSRGATPMISRQADVLMRILPIVKQVKEQTPKQTLSYVKRVLEIDSHCEKAWLELAAISKETKIIEPPDAVTNANRAFKEFANFPDFCWQLFDPLLTHQHDNIQRARVYEAAVIKFETLSRPDLACECRLKLSDYYVEAKDYKKAAEGLAQTIGKFPSEGRYVPKMMAKMQEICSLKEYKDGVKKLSAFYMVLLPKVPPTRGDTVSEYCVKLHEQALEFLKKNNQTKEAAVVQQQLAKLKGK